MPDGKGIRSTSISVSPSPAISQSSGLADGAGANDFATFMAELGAEHKVKARKLGLKIQTKKGIAAGADAVDVESIGLLPGNRPKDIAFNDAAEVSFFNRVITRTMVEMDGLAEEFRQNPEGFASASSSLISTKAAELEKLNSAFRVSFENKFAVSQAEKQGIIVRNRNQVQDAELEGEQSQMLLELGNSNTTMLKNFAQDPSLVTNGFRDNYVQLLNILAQTDREGIPLIAPAKQVALRFTFIQNAHEEQVKAIIRDSSRDPVDQFLSIRDGKTLIVNMDPESESFGELESFNSVAPNSEANVRSYAVTEQRDRNRGENEKNTRDFIAIDNTHRGLVTEMLATRNIPSDKVAAFPSQEEMEAAGYSTKQAAQVHENIQDSIEAVEFMTIVDGMTVQDMQTLGESIDSEIEDPDVRKIVRSYLSSQMTLLLEDPGGGVLEAHSGLQKRIVNSLDPTFEGPKEDLDTLLSELDSLVADKGLTSTNNIPNTIIAQTAQQVDAIEDFGAKAPFLNALATLYGEHGSAFLQALTTPISDGGGGISYELGYAAGFDNVPASMGRLIAGLGTSISDKFDNADIAEGSERTRVFAQARLRGAVLTRALPPGNDHVAIGLRNMLTRVFLNAKEDGRSNSKAWQRAEDVVIRSRFHIVRAAKSGGPDVFVPIEISMTPDLKTALSSLGFRTALDVAIQDFDLLIQSQHIQGPSQSLISELFISRLRKNSVGYMPSGDGRGVHIRTHEGGILQGRPKEDSTAPFAPVFFSWEDLLELPIVESIGFDPEIFGVS